MPMKTDTIEQQQQLIRQASPIYLAEQTALNPGLGLILADLTKRFAPKPCQEVKLCPGCNERDIYVTEEVCASCKEEEEGESPTDGLRKVQNEGGDWIWE